MRYSNNKQREERMEFLYKTNWDDTMQQVQRGFRLVLLLVFVTFLLAFVWIAAVENTKQKHKPQNLVARHEQDVQDVATFKVDIERKLSDQQELLANYERQIKKLTTLLGDSDLQLQALREASQK